MRRASTGPGDPAGSSGWGVIEYGATGSGAAQLTITATPSARALYKLATVSDVAPRTAAGPAANFDPFRANEWAVIRPGTAAGFNKPSGANDPALFDDFSTENTAAGISITDALTGLTYSGDQLTDAVLNRYLGFDATGWDWGATRAGCGEVSALPWCPIR
jgi:hypothetical protein